METPMTPKLATDQAVASSALVGPKKLISRSIGRVLLRAFWSRTGGWDCVDSDGDRRTMIISLTSRQTAKARLLTVIVGPLLLTSGWPNAAGER